MANKGSNISDLLISKESQLIIPPFLREKQLFSKKNSKKTSDIAKARIHVERAIARIKDFLILNEAFPITMKDLLDDIFFNLSCYYKFSTTSSPIMNQNQTGLKVYDVLIFV